MAKTKYDYIYCEDCKTMVDLWKYGSIEDTGHSKCRWRYVTEEELVNCVEDCEKPLPYCPKCDSILDGGDEYARDRWCSFCEASVNDEDVIYRN